MKLRKIIRTIITKENRKRLKKLFKIETLADKQKKVNKSSNNWNKNTLIYQENNDLILENEDFNNNTEIAIKKRGSNKFENLNVTISLPKIELSGLQFLTKLKTLQEEVEYFDIYAKFDKNDKWIRLKSSFKTESTQYVNQDITDDHVSLIKAYTTLDKHYSMLYGYFAEGLVAYDTDKETKVLKIKNLTGNEITSIHTTSGEIQTLQGDNNNLLVRFIDLISELDYQLKDVKFAFSTAVIEINMSLSNLSLTSNLSQKIVKVHVDNEKLHVTEVTKVKEQLILKYQEHLDFKNENLNIFAIRNSSVIPLEFSVSEESLCIKEVNKKMTKGFAYKLFIGRNLSENKIMYYPVYLKNENGNQNLKIIRFHEDNVDLLQNGGKLEVFIKENGGKKGLMIYNESVNDIRVFLRYKERAVFKEISYQNIVNNYIELLELRDKNISGIYSGLHVAYQLDNKIYTVYRRLDDIVLSEKSEEMG